MVSQIGYNDNRSTSTPNEELGIAWNDETGWAINHGIQIARYDVYYCDGSEYQATSGQDWVHKWNSQQRRRRSATSGPTTATGSMSTPGVVAASQ